MTTEPPPRTAITIRLRPDLLAQIDKAAANNNRTRSNQIERALDQAINGKTN